MRFRPRLMLSLLGVSLPAVGLMVAVSPAASASPAPSASATARAAALHYLRHLHIGQHATDHPVAGTSKRIKALTQLQSNNWSGYADNNTGGTTYTSVVGNWYEPSVTCTSTTSLAAFWVGIDGLTSGSVEQDGSLAECSGGTAYYYTWWEMYPTNAVQIVGTTLKPGQHIRASVVRSGTKYTLQVTDSTASADSFTKTETCSSCQNSSAEWIAEAPSGSNGIYPLSDFHTWTLGSSSVKSGSKSGVISTFSDDEITMVDGSGNVEAQPSALTGGDAFKVAWKRST
jgi:hypothetical protein